MRTLRLKAIVACAGLTMLAAPSAAHDYQIGSIRVIHPWSRATPPAVPVAGGYVRLTNVGEEPDRLLGVSSEIAERVELHESTVTDGIARMRPLADGLTVKAGETVELKPGQAHIMFIKPIRAFKEGERFAAVLRFEKAGALKVEFMVQGMGGRPAGKSEHEGHGAPEQ